MDSEARQPLPSSTSRKTAALDLAPRPFPRGRSSNTPRPQTRAVRRSSSHVFLLELQNPPPSVPTRTLGAPRSGEDPALRRSPSAIRMWCWGRSPRRRAVQVERSATAPRAPIAQTIPPGRARLCGRAVPPGVCSCGGYAHSVPPIGCAAAPREQSPERRERERGAQRARALGSGAGSRGLLPRAMGNASGVRSCGAPSRPPPFSAPPALGPSPVAPPARHLSTLGVEVPPGQSRPVQ